MICNVCGKIIGANEFLCKDEKCISDYKQMLVMNTNIIEIVKENNPNIHIPKFVYTIQTEYLILELIELLSKRDIKIKNNKLVVSKKSVDYDCLLKCVDTFNVVDKLNNLYSNLPYDKKILFNIMDLYNVKAISEDIDYLFEFVESIYLYRKGILSEKDNNKIDPEFKNIFRALHPDIWKYIDLRIVNVFDGAFVLNIVSTIFLTLSVSIYLDNDIEPPLEYYMNICSTIGSIVEKYGTKTDEGFTVVDNIDDGLHKLIVIIQKIACLKDKKSINIILSFIKNLNSKITSNTKSSIHHKIKATCIYEQVKCIIKYDNITDDNLSTIQTKTVERFIKKN